MVSVNVAIKQWTNVAKGYFALISIMHSGCLYLLPPDPAPRRFLIPSLFDALPSSSFPNHSLACLPSSLHLSPPRSYIPLLSFLSFFHSLCNTFFNYYELPRTSSSLHHAHSTHLLLHLLLLIFLETAHFPQSFPFLLCARLLCIPLTSSRITFSLPLPFPLPYPLPFPSLSFIPPSALLPSPFPCCPVCKQPFGRQVVIVWCRKYVSALRVFFSFISCNIDLVYWFGRSISRS